jgi:anti-sigma-K factor RskA
MTRFNEVPDENELIAYHLGELSPLRKRAVQAALEKDDVLAAESAEIAETLRAFASGPAPVADTAMMERTWQAVRPSLAILEPQKKEARWRWLFGFASGVAVCAVVLLMFAHHTSPNRDLPVANIPSTEQHAITARNDESPIIQELHDSQQAKTVHYNNRPGPLTTVPVEDTGFTHHLDNAERLLTQVNHQDGPLPVETRREVHHLLLENAVYQQRAQVQGDYATANVMDDLGRVLVTLDAAPPEDATSADAFRVQMNVGNVLFDLRILHHNKLEQR